MSSKADFIIHEALSVNAEERARIAHCLISSLEEPAPENVDREWLALAEKRMAGVEDGSVETTTWSDLKMKIRG